jgi:ribosome-associated protein
MSKQPDTHEHDTPALPADVLTAAQAAYGRKALDVVALDMRTIPSFTDVFLICTAQSQRQMRAVADAIEVALKDEGRRPSHIEGDERSEWILLDYFDMVVHVFTARQREFFALERLWGAAVRTAIPDQPA